MADLVVGLAKSVVEGTLSKATEAIEVETTLRESAKRNLVFIRGELEMMQSFLHLANAERVGNKVVMTWVRQIGELAYDVEDCVELVVNLDTKTSRWSWCGRVVPSACCCMLGVGVGGAARRLDEAMDEIAQLKGRMEDVSRRNGRYSLISDTGSKPVMVQQEQPTAAAVQAAIGSSMLIDGARGAAGRRRRRLPQGDLTRLLVDGDKDRRVISVWGSGGNVGVTPIVWKAFHDKEVGHKFTCRAWVKLAHPFHPSELVRCLLDQFGGEQEGVRNPGLYALKRTAQSTSNYVRNLCNLEKQLHEQRYLVVLEDMYTITDWVSIRKFFPPITSHGSRIIITTQESQVAGLCVGYPYQLLHLNTFSVDHTVYAFYKESDGDGGTEAVHTAPHFFRKKKAAQDWTEEQHVVRPGPEMGILCNYVSSNAESKVVSVWGTDCVGKLSLVRNMFCQTILSHCNTDAIDTKYDMYGWVYVAPSILENFYGSLFSSFESESIQAHTQSSGTGSQECVGLLQEKRCLIVIDGLKSSNEWDSIRVKLNPGSGCSSNCVIIITTKETVARYCIGESQELMINLNATTTEEGSDESVVVVVGDKETAARNWMRMHPFVGRESEMKSLKDYTARPFFSDECRQVMSVWGTARVGKHVSDARFELGKSALVRHILCHRIIQVHSADEENQDYEMYAWVDVSHPFNSQDFSRSLLLGFRSQSLQANKDDTDLPGNIDPILESDRILREQKCLVVIHGLHSEDDWDSIRDKLKTGCSTNCIVVITAKKRVAEFCSGGNQDLMIHVNAIEGELSQRVLGRKVDADKWILNNIILGRESEMNVLRPYTTQVLDLCILAMSVWGIPGVGKSSLVKKLFYDRIASDYALLEKNEKSIFDEYGWVDVSYPFNLKDFSRSLLRNFHFQSLETKETEYNDPIGVCHKILNDKICLVVIDGLQSTDEWDLIKAALEPEISKTCIIIITSEASIAKHCCRGDKEERVFNVKALDTCSAYSVFEKEVYGSRHPFISVLLGSDVDKLQELVSKCGGLPKVISEIARFLGKYSVDPMDRATSLCREFIYHLENNREFDNLQGLFAWMHTYFRSCPDSIKPCIFYSSIFPGDPIVRRRRLVRRWIAEGYSRDNHEESAEENGEKQFSDLLDLSIVLRSSERTSNATQSKTSMTSCHVNGFILEYILSKKMEENLVFKLGRGSSITTGRTGRHLVILEDWERDRTMFESMDFSHLRSLTVFGKWESFFISESMKMLRVLDLELKHDPKPDSENALTKDDLKKMVKVMLRLKFLSLRGHGNICRLPGSLHEMRQLQTLDVRGTSITTLPEKITKLEKMQYIRAGRKDLFPQDSASTNILDTPSRNGTRETPGPASPVHPPGQPGTCSWLLKFCRRQSSTDRAADLSRNSAGEVAVTGSSTGCCWLPGEFCGCHRDTFGVEVPIGIGKLTALHTLGVVDVASSGVNTIVKEFKKLTQLRKLGVSGINKKNSKKFFSAIEGHVHLESFSVRLDKEKEDSDNQCILVDMIALPCMNLRSLKLYGLEKELPEWVPDKLRKLTKLVLEMSSLTGQGTDLLGRLPDLCILRVRLLKDGKLDFQVEANCFENLKVLEIGCTIREMYVTFGSSTMKKLELLKVQCPGAVSPKFQFNGMQHLTQLKEVQLVKGDKAKTQKQQLESLLMKHPELVDTSVTVEEPPSSA